MSKSTQKPVLVAAIAGAFGVKGEVRLKSFTENPAACLSYAPFVDKDGKVILTITSSRRIKDGFAVITREIKTREEAEAQKSTRLYADRTQFAALDEDDFYQSDLVGLRAEDETGAPLGRIKAVLNFGAGDLLEIIQTPGIAQSWTIPFTKACVPTIDVAGGRVVLVDAPVYYDNINTGPDEEGEKP